MATEATKQKAKPEPQAKPEVEQQEKKIRLFHVDVSKLSQLAQAVAMNIAAQKPTGFDQHREIESRKVSGVYMHYIPHT